MAVCLGLMGKSRSFGRKHKLGRVSRDIQDNRYKKHYETPYCLLFHFFLFKSFLHLSFLVWLFCVALFLDYSFVPASVQLGLQQNSFSFWRLLPAEWLLLSAQQVWRPLSSCLLPLRAHLVVSPVAPASAGETDGDKRREQQGPESQRPFLLSVFQWSRGGSLESKFLCICLYITP